MSTAESKWRRIIERQEASGLSVRSYCARERLNPQNFYTWRKRFRAVEPVVALEAVRPTFFELGARDERIELESKSGIVARVPLTIDERTLRRLVDALEGR